MNRAKAKGTAWESAVCAYYREAGAVHAERRALRGALDAGDIAGVPGVADSCKSCREWRLSEWLDELQAMIRNARAAVGAIWLKRRGKASPADAYVVMAGATYVRLLREAGYLPHEESLQAVLGRGGACRG